MAEEDGKPCDCFFCKVESDPIAMAHVGARAMLITKVLEANGCKADDWTLLSLLISAKALAQQLNYTVPQVERAALLALKYDDDKAFEAFSARMQELVSTVLRSKKETIH